MNHRTWLAAVPVVATAGLIGTATVWSATHGIGSTSCAAVVSLVLLQLTMNVHMAGLRRALSAKS